MTDGDVLQRIDEHMARGNALMARITELTEDNRQFTRELLRRNEIVVAENTDAIRGMKEEMRQLRRESRAGRQVLFDLHEESLAQRQAIWTLIDELREHGLGGRN